MRQRTMSFPSIWTPRLGLALAALTAACVLPAPGAAPPLEPGFTVRSWDQEDGLPASPRFYALARTPDGYLWIGSEVGLVRFDGARFVTLTTNDVPALGHNHILSLLADTNGVLWVGTASGTLAARVNGSFSAMPLDPRLRGAPIMRLASGPDGALWVSAAGYGLVRWARGVWDFSFPTNGLPAGSGMPSFVVENGGRVWAQINDFLWSQSSGAWERFNFQPGRPSMRWLPPGKVTGFGWRFQCQILFRAAGPGSSE